MCGQAEAVRWISSTLAYRAGYHPLPWHASSRPVTAHYVCAACACVLGYVCMYACVRTAWGRLAARLACGDHIAAELAAKAAKGKRRAQPTPAPSPAPTPSPAPAPARARWLLLIYSLLTTYLPTYYVYSSPGGAPALYRGISRLYCASQSAAAAACLSGRATPAGYHPSPPPHPHPSGQARGRLRRPLPPPTPGRLPALLRPGRRLQAGFGLGIGVGVGVGVGLP